MLSLRSITVAGDEVNDTCVLQIVLDSGSGFFIIREAGLRRLHCRFPGLPIVFPYEGGPSVAVADGREQMISPQAGVLTSLRLTPWAPVVIRLAVVVFPGRDDVLILSSKMLREKINIDIMARLRAKALGYCELAESEHGLTAYMAQAPP